MTIAFAMHLQQAHLLHLAALSAAMMLPATLWAQTSTAATVTVGKFSKRVNGTVVDMNAGDVACYLTLKDEKVGEFTEMADFELCNKPKAYLGRRVALTYTLGTVMADSCQGNPSCKKTQTVALVSAMNVLSASPTSRPAPPSAIGSRKQPTFCTDKETVVFACRTGAKLVSVCASQQATRTKGYLQYRFGKPEAPEALELTLPETEELASKAATGENVPFAGGGGAWLRFKRGPYGYVVYNGIGKWGPKGETQEKSGIVVERSGKEVAHLKCTDGTQSVLGPDWFEAFGVHPKSDEEFLFPD